MGRADRPGGAAAGVLLLAAAVLVHGAVGLPAPQAVGLAEAVVGACLLMAAGLGTLVRFGSGAVLLSPGPAWAVVGASGFLWLLWIPLLRGAAAGHAPEDVVRDVVPLVFLFLPLLLTPGLARLGPRAVDVLAAALALAGVLIAARWLLSGLPAGPVPERYLPNDPAVLFAAIWLPAVGFRLARRLPAWPAAAVLAAAGALCLAALVLQVNRSASIVAAAALLAVFAWSWRSAGIAGACVVAAAGSAVWMRSDLVFSTMEAFAAKTQAYGTNGRLAELAAVAERAASTWDGLLFGAGWGALLRNPAVGDWWVSYTHGLPGYLLFKTGLAGCAVAGLWAVCLLAVVVRVLRRDMALGLAVVAPLLVGGMVHTGYKYFCYGVLLTLLTLADDRRGVHFTAENRGRVR
jgi:hypothetical protein